MITIIKAAVMYIRWKRFWERNRELLDERLKELEAEVNQM